MIYIISQPPNDEFTSRLFFKCIDTLTDKNINFDAFYIWSWQLAHGLRKRLDYGIDQYDFEKKYIPEETVHNHSFWIDDKFFIDFINKKIKESIVVIGVKDFLGTKDFNPWLDTEPHLIQVMNEWFETHRDKTFILFTSVLNLQEYIVYKNVKVVYWGGCANNQMIEYSKKFTPVEKNFTSGKTFLSLNRNYRAHRAHTLSYIFYKNIEEYGSISCLFQKEINESFNSHEWIFNHDDQEMFHLGSIKIAKYTNFLQDDYEIYPKKDNDNFYNLETVLKNYYEHCFVEIISETTFGDMSPLITEKSINAFFGRCFPIWLSSVGTVKYFRDIGFDVFDDIVDHSYDNESHPIVRIKTAIDDNIQILSNIDYVKKLWKNNVHRFNSNLEHFRQHFYLNTWNNAVNEFSRSI